MKPEKLEVQEDLNLDALQKGDLLRLSFGRMPEGNWITGMEFEVEEQLPKSVRGWATGGPMEWEEQVEVEITPIALGSIVIKTSVGVGKRIGIRFFDEQLQQLQLVGQFPVMEGTGGNKLMYEEVVSMYGEVEAKKLLESSLGWRLGTLPAVTWWETNRPEGGWIDWPIKKK